MIAMKQEMLYSLLMSNFRFSCNISFQNTIGIYTYIIKNFPYYTHQKQINHFKLQGSLIMVLMVSIQWMITDVIRTVGGIGSMMGWDLVISI